MNQPLMPGRHKFRLRTLLLVVGIVAIVLGFTTAAFRWRQNVRREHDGIVQVTKFGGTVTFASAKTLVATGQPPSWFFRTFRNHVAHVDFSTEAWPRSNRPSAGKNWPSVNDETLRILRAFPDLQSLDLRGSEVTDECVLNLKRLTHLRELDLADTPVTEVGVVDLKSALPNCVIRHNQ